MPDISIIILTYNEQLHIERCIRNPLPSGDTLEQL